MNGVTSDNSHYRAQISERNAHAPYLQSIAQEAVSVGLPDHVRDYLSLSIAENSRRAYVSDINRFLRWGGALPSDATTVATYLADHAETHSVATLRRWAASLSRAHSTARLPDPTKEEPARSTLRGICRSRGEASRGADPLLRQDLFSVLDEIHGNSLRDMRDYSLLLMGFAAGFRRSELVGLNYEDVECVRHGMIINLRRSKTDQTAIGRQIAIPFGKTRHCPVRALEAWAAAAGITEGAIYRSMKRKDVVLDKRLSGEAVSYIVKQRVSACGIDPRHFSGHSLRAGFATSAAQAGVSSWKIRQQTGHTSDAMLARYIRDADLFIDNAAGAVL